MTQGPSGPVERQNQGVKKRLVTVLGHISPHEWDSEGRLLRVRISSDDGSSYVLCPGGYGERLLEMVGVEVQVCGTVEEHEGKRQMRVRSFDAVDDFNLLDDEVEPGFEAWVEEPEPSKPARARQWRCPRASGKG